MGRKAEGCARALVRQLQATHMMIGEPSYADVAPTTLGKVSLELWQIIVGARKHTYLLDGTSTGTYLKRTYRYIRPLKATCAPVVSNAKQKKYPHTMYMPPQPSRGTNQSRDIRCRLTQGKVVCCGIIHMRARKRHITP